MLISRKITQLKQEKTFVSHWPHLFLRVFLRLGLFVKDVWKKLNSPQLQIEFSLCLQKQSSNAVFGNSPHWSSQTSFTNSPFFEIREMEKLQKKIISAFLTFKWLLSHENQIQSIQLKALWVFQSCTNFFIPTQKIINRKGLKLTMFFLSRQLIILKQQWTRILERRIKLLKEC